MLEIITSVLLIAFLVILIWFGICNERTSRYRQKMIDDAFGPPYGGPDYDAREELRQEYKSVGYSTHTFHIMMFRSVDILYPKYHAKKVKNV